MLKQSGFECRNCHKLVKYEAWGTRNRNHCPYCLYSLHIDVNVGDRSSPCGGLMIPTGKLLKTDGEEIIVHKCLKCGLVRKNRIAGDDSVKLVANLPVVDTF